MTAPPTASCGCRLDTRPSTWRPPLPVVVRPLQTSSWTVTRSGCAPWTISRGAPPSSRYWNESRATVPQRTCTVSSRERKRGDYSARASWRRAGTLPEETIVVSVESSAVIPGVAQGAGPVVRTGDALTTFDSEAERLLAAAVVSIRRREPEFRAQRQLMSGGVCEATAFSLAGYAVTGVAFPLGKLP